MTAAIRAGAYLHHIEIESAEPARLAAFYADALDMTTRRLEGAGARWLCEGPSRRVLFSAGANKRLAFAAFACRDAEGLAEIRARANQFGATLAPSPSPLFGNESFAVVDPDQNVVAFGLSRPEAASQAGRLRAPLQHLTLASRQPEAIERFYVDALGFAVSDWVRKDDGIITTVFLRSNHEHHNLGCFRQERTGVDHHSYEAGEWATIKEWCDRLGDRSIPIMWGPGRHGPGNNIFIFIEDPDGNWIEISAELETIHDRPPKIWRHEPRTLNSWGRAIMRV